MTLGNTVKAIKPQSRYVANQATVADDMEEILEYCNRIPKDQYEHFKEQIYYKAKIFGAASTLFANAVKRPTNAQRKKKLLKVAEHAAALSDALYDLTEGNYLHDLIKVKSGMRKSRAKTQRPFKWPLTTLFGSKLNSLDKFNIDPSQDSAENIKLLKEALEAGEIPVLHFIYTRTGIAQLLSHLEKEAVRQEKRIKTKKGGRAKSSLKEDFVEFCTDFFEEVSSFPITTTVDGEFRGYIEIMNKLAFGNEGQLENEIKAIVKRRKKAKGDKTLNSQAE